MSRATVLALCAALTGAGCGSPGPFEGSYSGNLRSMSCSGTTPAAAESLPANVQVTQSKLDGDAALALSITLAGGASCVLPASPPGNQAQTRFLWDFTCPSELTQAFPSLGDHVVDTAGDRNWLLHASGGITFQVSLQGLPFSTPPCAFEADTWLEFD
jgi:hypothetical protein